MIAVANCDRGDRSVSNCASRCIVLAGCVEEDIVSVSLYAIGTFDVAYKVEDSILAESETEVLT